MQNWPQTVQSQYTSSPNLTRLLSSINDWISPDANFEAFYGLIWNVDTAQSYGLDVWGRIVGVTRVISLSATNFFGLTSSVTEFTGSISDTTLTVATVSGTITVGQVITDVTGALASGTTITGQISGTPGGVGTYQITPPQIVASETMVTNIVSSGDPFTVSSFYDGDTITTNYVLSDDAFRQLILAKAAANITDGSIPSINAILMNLFPGRGNAFVQDNLDMTMTYVFTFPLQPFEQAIVASSGVLPRSTGVAAGVSFP